jgi:N6-L-threonylcarbamoyladenine synthase
MRVLGIESSCDETAASIVENGHHMLSNVIASSMDLHIPYGGVVPEIAARSHIEVILPVIEQAFTEAQTKWKDINAIAVTFGAGLSGSLLIGVMTARTLALALQKPLYAVNHVAGHVYANFITSSSLPGYTLPKNTPKFPMLAIIVSGGHSQLVLYRDHFDYSVLGQTHDDAIGEAFDKVAKMLGLPYPGGPSIAKIAVQGNPRSFELPRAKMAGYDFSFSGPKTAVLRLSQSQIGESYDFPSYKLAERLSEAQKANIAASFQFSAIQTVVSKATKAFHEYQPKSVVIAGGVAASTELRRQLSEAIPLDIYFPDSKLCTDNAAMIATLGSFMHNTGQQVANPYTLDISPNLVM